MTSFPRTLPPTRPEVSGSTDGESNPRWIEIAKSADHKVISLVLTRRRSARSSPP
jgi:hypothetical protein